MCIYHVYDAVWLCCFPPFLPGLILLQEDWNYVTENIRKKTIVSRTIQCWLVHVHAFILWEYYLCSAIQVISLTGHHHHENYVFSFVAFFHLVLILAKSHVQHIIIMESTICKLKFNLCGNCNESYYSEFISCSLNVCTLLSGLYLETYN